MQKTMMSESLNMGMTTMSAASKNGWHKKKNWCPICNNTELATRECSPHQQEWLP